MPLVGNCTILKLVLFQGISKNIQMIIIHMSSLLRRDVKPMSFNLL